jgi:hypothetical protein
LTKLQNIAPAFRVEANLKLETFRWRQVRRKEEASIIEYSTLCTVYGCV